MKNFYNYRTICKKVNDSLGFSISYKDKSQEKFVRDAFETIFSYSARQHNPFTVKRINMYEDCEFDLEEMAYNEWYDNEEAKITGN